MPFEYNLLLSQIVTYNFWKSINMTERFVTVKVS